MRILWVKVGGLWPLTAGNRLLSFNLVSQLSHQHRVSVLTTHGPADDPGELEAKLPACDRVTSVSYTAPKHGSVRCTLTLAASWFSPLACDLRKWRIDALRRAVTTSLATGEFDVCVADSLFAIPNVPRSSTVPIVLFEHNVEYTIWQRLGRAVPLWHRPFLAVEWRKIRRYEARACRLASLTIAVSEVDRARLASIATGARVCAIRSGVDTMYFAPNGNSEAPTHLVFTGAMDWYPNEDAILFFIDTILPLIRREIPDASLTVVGRNPSSRLRVVADQAGVHVTGTVDDVRPYVAEASIFIVPLRVGGGTRLKIFEALAMAKAVVSTTVGAEGLPLVPGTHFLQADDPSTFARAVVSLFRDPTYRHTLGRAGRLIAERYSWAEVAQVFANHCEHVVAEHAGARVQRKPSMTGTVPQWSARS